MRYFLLLCFFLVQNLSAQNVDFKFKRLISNKELSNRTITSILQDEQGFIWFGTLDGLIRYDGHSTKIFKKKFGDSNSLSDNAVRALIQDHEGIFWIGTQGGGLNRFDPETEQFTHYANDPDDDYTLSSDAVWAIHEDSKKRLWLGTFGGGLCYLDRDQELFFSYQNDLDLETSISHNIVRSILEDESGTIWVGTEGGGLNSFNAESEEFKRYQNAVDDSTSLRQNSVYTILEDHTGKLWIGTYGGGLNLFDESEGRFKAFTYDSSNPSSISNDYVFDLFQDRENRIWVATDGGLNLLDPTSKKFTSYNNDPGDLNSLSTDRIRAIGESNEGIIWIGTEGSGVNKIVQKAAFQHFYYSENDPSSLGNNLIRTIYEDSKGRLWIGANNGGGLNLFEPPTNSFIKFLNDPENGNSMSNNNPSAIGEDKYGNLWVGTWGNGLNRFSPDLQTVDRFGSVTEDKSTLTNGNIQSILLHSSGDLWVGTESGLNKFNYENESWKQFYHEPGNSNSLGANGVQSKALIEDKNGIIWIGAWGGGITRLDPSDNTFMNWNNSEEEQLFSNNAILSVYDDDKGNLWLGTFGGGLNKFDKASHTVQFFTEEDGLSNNVIYGILGDNEGNLWLSTNNGLSKFNPETEKFRNFDVSDGIQSNEFYWGAAFKKKNGEMVFGGINGYNVFSPTEISDNTFVPPIAITEFRLFNSPPSIGKDSLLEKQINYLDQFDLKYDQNVLSLEFASLNFILPEKNQYAYQLEGFDIDWNYVGTNTKASYTNLDPGTYFFKVKGSNNDGLWNEEGDQVKITIVAPFWQTWWFYATIAISVIVFIYSLIKRREQVIKREKAKLEEKINEAVSTVEEQKQELVREKEVIELNNWINKGFAKFSEIMTKDKNDLYKFSHNILKSLLEYVKADMGALFLYDDSKECFGMYASYAMGFSDEEMKKYVLGEEEGLVGMTFKEEETKYIKKIPDGYFSIKSGLGDSKPKAILLIPLKFDDLKVGVIEMAALKEFKDYEIEFMEKVAQNITSTISTVRMSEQTRELLRQSKLQEEQLKESEEELHQNLEELQATQEDAKRKIDELESQLENLKSKEKKTKSRVKKEKV
ncbi:MAG: two-component regulator propeller domain-containing protein [Bacteroidota bacterium]